MYYAKKSEEDLASIMQQLIATLKETEARSSLDYQRQKYGVMLQRSLPVATGASDLLEMLYQYPPQQADVFESFENFVKGLVTTENSQNNLIGVIYNVSGAGKTKVYGRSSR